MKKIVYDNVNITVEENNNNNDINKYLENMKPSESDSFKTDDLFKSPEP